MRFSLRTFLLLAVVGPIFIAGFIYVPQTIWDGGFDLNLHLVNNTGKAIDRIEAAAVASHQYSEFYVAHPDHREQPRWSTVTLDGGGVGQVYVNSAGHVNAFTGIELSYWRSEAVVVRVEFTDGSRSQFAVDVPERGKRHIEVDIPTPK